MTGYVKQEFPMVVYSEEHSTGVTVKSQDELDNLEGDWFETPALWIPGIAEVEEQPSVIVPQPTSRRKRK